MKKGKIKRIVCVEPQGQVGVELYGMRNDLKLLFIDTREINWFGVDANGYSVVYSLSENVEIFYKELFTATRRLHGVSFVNDKSNK